MRLSPTLIQALVDVAARAAAAGHGGKEAVYAEACRVLGLSRATLFAYLKEVTVKAPRKTRSDAGKSGISTEVLQLISVVMMEGYRANDKKIVSVETAVESLIKEGKIPRGRVDEDTGEIKPWSLSAIRRALYAAGLHPEQLRRATPATAQKSAHPNDVWQIDASISTLFYVPESGLADMSPAEFYKNKPGNFEKIKRQRLTRYVITDHCSGAIFVHYVAGGESIVNMTDALLRAIVERPKQMLYGAPFHLMMDPGSAGESGPFKSLLRRLLIEPVTNAAGNPRAKGQVENAHNIVECSFESGFKLVHVPNIDWINEQAARWMRWFNNTRTHSRHGLTRAQKWMEITAEQLRVLDASIDPRMLAYGKQETRVVNGYCNIEFKGNSYRVGHVPGVMIDEQLNVAVNPFEPNSLFAVVLDAERNEQLIPLPRVEKDEHGFDVDAAHIAREYKAPADTVIDTNRKLIERLSTGAETDEAAKAARKAKVLPLGGEVNPFNRFDDVPDVTPLPRRSTALGVAVNVGPAPEIILNHFEVARALVAKGITMDADKNRQVMNWYPAGVPESELDALAQRLTARAGLRVVGG